MSPVVWWLIAAVVLLVVEMLTPGLFFFACFGIGALVASLMSLLDTPAWATWAAFFAISLLLILLVAPIARRWMKRARSVSVGLDSIEGQVGRVIVAINPETGIGQVRLSNGAVWRAACDQPLTEGTQVKIIQITGTTLQVNPAPEAIIKER
jgi:membrane protein implicated in regulation of membrane protease activity